MILMVIATHAGAEDYLTIVGHETIAQEANLSERTLTRYLNELEKTSELAIIRGNGKGRLTSYKIDLPKWEKGDNNCHPSERQRVTGKGDKSAKADSICQPLDTAKDDNNCHPSQTQRVTNHIKRVTESTPKGDRNEPKGDKTPEAYMDIEPWDHGTIEETIEENTLTHGKGDTRCHPLPETGQKESESAEALPIEITKTPAEILSEICGRQLDIYSTERVNAEVTDLKIWREVVSNWRLDYGPEGTHRASKMLEAYRKRVNGKNGETVYSASIPVAVRTVYALTEQYPDKSLWPAIVRLLGDRCDEAKLKKCYAAWVVRGWNKMNLKWLFEWYVNGIPSDLDKRQSAQRRAGDMNQGGRGKLVQ